MAARKFTRITGAMQASALVEAEPDRLFGGSRSGMRFVEPRLEDIDLNPHQPRRYFDPDALRSLCDSIEQHGQKQPVGVQKQDNGRWLLVFGERRYRACQTLGRPTINAVVTDGDPFEIALIENLQREDLSVFETADAFARLMETRGYNRSTLARVVGTAPSTITRLMALLALPPSIRQDYESGFGQVAKSLILELVDIADPERQALAWDAVKSGATVRDIRALKQAPSPAGSAPTAAPESASEAGARRADPLDRTVGRFEKLIQPIREGRKPLDDAQRSRLTALRRLIDEVLGE